MTLYQALLMDHYHHPRNYGTLENPHFESGDMNPSCGDSVSFQGIIENNHLKQIRFTAQGCVISVAAASSWSLGNYAWWCRYHYWLYLETKITV